MTRGTPAAVARCVTQSYIIGMSLLPNLRPGGRHGVASTETRDPIGYLVAGLNRLAQSDLLDRIGLRKQTEQAVFTVTRSGFRTITTASRTFARAGSRGKAGRPSAGGEGRAAFDLTPTEDEQLLVDVVTEFADRGGASGRGRGRRGLRGARGGAQGRPRDRAADPRPARVARRDLRGALGDGRDAGRRGARPGRHGAGGRRRWRPGSVATAIGLWGTDEQQQTYLPAFTGDDVPAAALALTEPTVLFDVLTPAHHRGAHGRRLRAQRREVRWSRAAPRPSCSWSVPSSTAQPVLFLVESSHRRARPSRPTRRWACAPPG